MTDKDALLRLRREQNSVMAEVLKKHARAMAYMAGEPYEPVAHAAEAILVGVGAGSAA